MKQNIAIIKAIESIQKYVELSEEQYNSILHHLHLIYVAGYEEGYKNIQPVKGFVIFLNGYYIHSFNSIQEVAEFVHAKSYRVRKAINKNNKINGYNIKLIK